MTDNISPNVYTKILDISSYAQQVPSTIGLICALTRKGPDNVIYFVDGQEELITKFGLPNIDEFGKDFSQGLYIANEFIKESGALYFIRCLPEDASYANLSFNIIQEINTDPEIDILYIPKNESTNENQILNNLESIDATSFEVYPICIFYPIGRGSYYNSISIKLKRSTDPIHTRGSHFDEFYLYIYEIQKDKSNQIIETFVISFESTATDYQGESIFVEDILNKYSNILKCKMTKSDGEYTDGYKLYLKTYSQKKGILTLETDSIFDNKQDFSQWSQTENIANFCIILKDHKNTMIYGWLGDVIPNTNSEGIYVYKDNELSEPGWIGDTTSFTWESPSIKYEIRKQYIDIETLFNSSNNPIPLRKGSEGSLIVRGEVDKTVAKNILIDGYSGFLQCPVLNSYMTNDKITDTDFIYFSMVFDGGYPSDIKSVISNLCISREDCISILDNNDNKTIIESLSGRKNINKYDNFYTCLYEQYSKIFDEYTGKDIWVSPIYHMASLFPKNDRVNEIWNAVSGFDFILDKIKELRFSASNNDKDNLYEKQLNTILKYSVGCVPWGQLTSLKDPSAMQDINIVRLVLYCKVAIKRYCNNYIFKENNSFVWNDVSRNIMKFLDIIKITRGLYSYNVEVGASEAEIKQKKFHVNIILKPTRISEKIELNFFIQ